MYCRCALSWIGIESGGGGGGEAGRKITVGAEGFLRSNDEIRKRDSGTPTLYALLDIQGARNEIGVLGVFPPI